MSETVPLSAEQLRETLARFRADPASRYPDAVQKATFLARVLQERASELQTPQERKQQAELDRMIDNPHDRSTLTLLTDQAFRADNPRRAVDQLTHILDVQGIPRFFGAIDRTLLKGFQSFGGYLPGVAVPLVKEKMREETANVILPAEPEHLRTHLEARHQAGVRMNVNYLGEALLGEGEAERRLQSYLQALQLPEIEVLSVKISTIYSQISSLARAHTVKVLCDRLELLYRGAAKERFRRPDGSEVSKFIYLDMEEYRDLAITTEVFQRTLERPGLEQVEAGMALQAYIPDSFAVQKSIHAWARRRVAAGGAPVTLRIVKGANMEVERLEASLQGWPQAPYTSKVETDANYKRMLEEGLRAENLDAVRVGVASHNLFDLAYGVVLAVEADALERVQFEMLEGMANHQRRALFELTRNLLLYAPATRRENFVHAIGYLIRRLDENAGSDNFLRHAFRIAVDSSEWKLLEKGFLHAFDVKEGLSDAPRRFQDRAVAPSDFPPESDDWSIFSGDADTDFALPRNVAWAEGILQKWRGRSGEDAARIACAIAGEELYGRPPEEAATPLPPDGGRDVGECLDPSRPGVLVGRYAQATVEDVHRAVACAKADDDDWRTRPQSERTEVLLQVAGELRRARGDLMGAALADGGKTLLESDSEVSEAIDFARFYPRTADFYHGLKRLEARGKGVVVVVPPWNFPIAIPCGGVVAALAAGNTVILKPASDSVLVAWELCKCFWRAGISQKVLQFAPCSGRLVGSKLVAHPDVDAVILTGGTSTALAMLSERPEMNLFAETGGKNATVVTALADRDQAIKHVLHSAFSHGGQKCSATSLLILEAEVYEDERFKETLRDAVESLRVGSAWEVESRVGPLIRAPRGDLEKGLKELEPGESWLVLPRRVGDNPNLYSPGVKWGVQPGSYTHRTEFFGPLLGVMRARNLRHAIALVNASGYGLTSGLESLDEREHEEWREGVRAGNLYINRVTTGAVVLRQPFGGFGKSAFGPGIKAGGPNYVAQLMDFEERAASPDAEEPGIEAAAPAESGDAAESVAIADSQLRAFREELLALSDPAAVGMETDEPRRLVAAMASYDRAFRTEFGIEQDHFRLVGQDNFRRYLPVGHLRVRVHPRDTVFEIIARVVAAKTAGCQVTLSLPQGFASAAVAWLESKTEAWAASLEIVEESDVELAAVVREQQTDRVRYTTADRVPREVYEAVGDSGIYIARTPVLSEGRVELLWYLREQSVSIDYHRYGNLGGRASEGRAPGM